MRIALVNYRYFFSGGPERYMFNVMDLLERRGHTVIPYSVRHALNEPSEYEADFLSPVGRGNEVYFSDLSKGSLSALVKGWGRMVYSWEARKSFRKFIAKHRPDVVYILYYQNKMSCSIVDAAHEAGVPVVHRLSDYSLAVPCSMMYDQRRRQLCEKCLQGSRFHAVAERCIYGSAVCSAVKVLALQVQRWRKIHDKTAAYVFPSAFTMGKYIEAGFDRTKLHFIPTFFNMSMLTQAETTWGDYALYVGRIDPDKGVGTMVDAFAGTPYKLKIVGYSSKDYLGVLKDKLKNVPHHIEFLGKKDFSEIQGIMAGCLFTIIPSEWYDNLPNALLESFAMKKCVVASDMGSLAENVENGKSGLLFESGNAADLRRKVHFLFANKEKAREWGMNAAEIVKTRFDAEAHYQSLLDLFHKIVQSSKSKRIEPAT